MSKTCALFNTTRLFDTDPDYESDSPDNPPPGRKVCNSLIEHLKSQGVSVDFDQIPEDQWEHSNWYFWGKWHDVRYEFIVQTNCSFESPLRCYIGIAKTMGVFGALFGKREKAWDVPMELMQMVIKHAESISDSNECNVINEEDAADAVWAD